MRFDPAEIASADAGLRSAGPEAVLRWAFDRLPVDRIAVVTGLQAEGVLLLDLALEIDSRVRAVTIDTGRLPAESHAYIDTLRARHRRDIEVLRPEGAEVVGLVAAHGPDAFFLSPELRLECCRIRKVRPLDAYLRGVDCWITGQRRDQAATRAGVGVVEVDAAHDGILKLNPLAALTAAEVRARCAARGLPLHPLYAQGYASIGCAPCTRAIRPGEAERAGRWWWERGVDAECGIHRAPTVTTAVEAGR